MDILIFSHPKQATSFPRLTVPDLQRVLLAILQTTWKFPVDNAIACCKKLMVHFKSTNLNTKTI
jgi:hypothetical protein